MTCSYYFQNHRETYCCHQEHYRRRIQQGISCTLDAAVLDCLLSKYTGLAITVCSAEDTKPQLFICDL